MISKKMISKIPKSVCTKRIEENYTRYSLKKKKKNKMGV